MTTPKIPDWIDSKLFENVLRETITDFQEIQQFKVFPALAPGENYSTLILKLQMEILLTNNSTQNHSLILKIDHDYVMHSDQLSVWNVFSVETGMYSQIIPELEKMYADAGVGIHMGAKAYDLPVQHKYLLLEDLSKIGFKNAKRQDCLDMDHCKGVLQKLAQLHAASAVRVEQKGLYAQQYSTGILNENGKDLLKTMLGGSFKHLLSAVQTLENYQEYYQQLESLKDKLPEVFFEHLALDVTEFNVLNHGDCWANNIMFQYDSEGKVQETFLVDLQTPRYGTPAQDLLYFIISSAQLDIKVAKFDDMIKYYHKHLSEYLALLKYNKPIPSLKDIHRSLIKFGLWGVFASIMTLPAVLCDVTDGANADNLLGDTEESDKFKALLYTNENITKHYKVILPWLYNRGAMEN